MSRQSVAAAEAGLRPLDDLAKEPWAMTVLREIERDVELEEMRVMEDDLDHDG